MISLGAFLVFLLVLAIVSTYVALVRHFIVEAAEKAETPPPPAATVTAQQQPAAIAGLRPAPAH